MKKVFLIPVCILFFSTAALSAEPSATHNWELAPEISSYTYKEPGIMKDSGILYGITGAYTYRKNFMLRLEGRYDWGQVDYTSTSSGEISNIDYYILELRGLAGYDFKINNATTITPYIGLGYRYLLDDSTGRISTTGAYGYKRESNYYYSPVGLFTMTVLGGGWSLGLNAEYDIFWKGKQKSHLGEVPGYYDIENDQNHGYGARGSVTFQKKLTNADLFIEPYIIYWHISASDVTRDPAGRGWYEPDNNTTQYGAKVGLKF